MTETVQAYLVSLGIIVAGVVWIVAGEGQSAICFFVGIATILVGLISFLNELTRTA